MTSYIPILKQFCFPAPRYRKDIYDRTWVPLFMKEWTQISTDLEVKNDNDYVPPEVALATAATPTDANAPLTIEWTNSENPDEQYYVHIDTLLRSRTCGLMISGNSTCYGME